MFSEENSFVKDLKTSFIIAVTTTVHNIVFTLKLIDRFYRLNAATSYRYLMRKFCSEDFLNTSALCQHQQRTVKFKGPFKGHFVGYSWNFKVSAVLMEHVIKTYKAGLIRGPLFAHVQQSKGNKWIMQENIPSKRTIISKS